MLILGQIEGAFLTNRKFQNELSHHAEIFFVEKPDLCSKGPAGHFALPLSFKTRFKCCNAESWSN